MGHVDSALTDSGQVHRAPAQSASHTRTQDGDRQDSAWTVVNVAEPQDSADDDDRSLVEISRVSSPLMVQFRSLELADRPQAQIPWPSSLPWFQFQDRFFDNVAARAMFSKQFQLTPGAVGNKATAKTSLVVPSQQQSLTTQVGFNHAVSKVNNLMPEQFDGENAGRVKALTGADPLEAKMQEFQLFAYQLSNNLIEDEDDKYIDEDGKYSKIMEIFRGIDLPLPVWKDLIVKSLEQPTGRALTEALFAAAVNTRTLDICEALLEAGADPDKVIWTWAWANLARPIQLAMYLRVGGVDLARLLIRFGAGVDLVTEDHPDTALQKAAKECTFEAVRVLVEAGASIVDATWDKRYLTPDTALTNAVDADWRMSHIRDEAEEDELEKSGRVRHGLQTLKYLLTLYDRERHHDVIQDGLIRAASGDRRDMIMDLVQAGAGVNEASSWGYTPLIAAAASSYEGNRARMVKMLLDLGADVDRAFRHSGICAIHIAAAKGDEKVIRLLIDRGADVNAPASDHTSRDRSLLDSHFDRDGLAADTLREMNACQRPLQFALFKDKAKESNYSQKGGGAALALIRAGATLEGGELARAGCFDDVGFLRELLSRGADVNEVDGTGRSALQACLELGNFNLVGCLLESGATVRKGQLFSAAKGGRRDVVETLLNHGAVTDERDAECSVLEAAASSKNWELMVWLMETHDVPYDEGALCAAICSGLGSSKENEKYLLSLQKRRTNDTKGGTLEATALGYAAFHRQEWVLQHLLQLKTKGPCIIPVKDDEGYQHLAQVHPGVMSWAYEEPFWRHPAMARCSVLVPALLRHDWRTVRRLLRAGHQPDRLSLLVAIEGQSLKAIASLAKRMDKLDICQPARSNLDTPLQAAVRHRRVAVAQYLLSLGANVNAQASGRLIVCEDWCEPLLPRTALQAAVENGHVEMMDLLLDAGADVNGPPGRDSGATALQIAAGKGHIGIVRRLLGRGGDVNAKGAVWSGRTALEAAAEWGRLDMVQFLVEEGAGVGGCVAYRRQYVRAVELAGERGHDAVVRVLGEWRRKIVADLGDEESESGESWYNDENEDDYDDDYDEDDDYYESGEEVDEDDKE